MFSVTPKNQQFKTSTGHQTNTLHNTIPNPLFLIFNSIHTQVFRCQNQSKINKKQAGAVLKLSDSYTHTHTHVKATDLCSRGWPKLRF